MKRYRPEIGLALAMAAVFAFVSHWQAPGRTLTKAAIDEYIPRIDAGVDLPPAEKLDLLDHLRAWGERDDGRPVFMLNLMRYYEAPRHLEGHPALTGSPRDLNAHYEGVVTAMLLKLGAYPLFAGEPDGVGSGASSGTNLAGFEEALENWSRVLIVRYPDRRAFFELLSNPEYHKVLPYKLAALKLVLLPMHDQIVATDLRWVVAAAMVGVLALVTIIRAPARPAN